MIQQLIDCAEEGAASGVHKHAHTLKGATSNVGGEQLRALATALEVAGKEADLEQIRTLTPRLKPAHTAFQDAARAVLEERCLPLE